jgi:hypothetical protein
MINGRELSFERQPFEVWPRRLRRKEHVDCAEPDGRRQAAQVAPGLLFPPLLEARRIRFGGALAQRTRKLFRALGQGMNCRGRGVDRRKVTEVEQRGMQEQELLVVRRQSRLCTLMCKRQDGSQLRLVTLIAVANPKAACVTQHEMLQDEPAADREYVGALAQRPHFAAGKWETSGGSPKNTASPTEQDVPGLGSLLWMPPPVKSRFASPARDRSECKYPFESIPLSISYVAYLCL